MEAWSMLGTENTMDYLGIFVETAIGKAIDQMRRGRERGEERREERQQNIEGPRVGNFTSNYTT
jgi:hypothetical protein